MIRILRLPAVLAIRGKSRTQHYNDVNAGLFTTPIKLSARASGWPESETEAITRAVIAGRSQDEIRALVAKLEAARKVADEENRDPSKSGSDVSVSSIGEVRRGRVQGVSQ